MPVIASRVPSGESATIGHSAAPRPIPEGRLTATRTTGTPAEAGVRRMCHPSSIAAAAHAAAMPHGNRGDRRGAAAGLASGPAHASASSSSSAMRTSAMSCIRCFGSRCRQRRRISRTRRGVPGGSAAKSGSRVRIAATMSETVSPANACRPVRHSKRTHPKAQMSARLSTGRPRACSGAM